MKVSTIMQKDAHKAMCGDSIEDSKNRCEG